jgi:hypothetical protein
MPVSQLTGRMARHNEQLQESESKHPLVEQPAILHKGNVINEIDTIYPIDAID